MVLANAGSWPAWAGSDFEGEFTRMVRAAHDPESGRTFLSYLRVDLKVDEIDTQWGPTRVTTPTDAVMVESKNGGSNFSEPVEVSGGAPDAKLDPRIDARGGKACLTWCGCHPQTKSWRIFAVYSMDGENWSTPMAMPGDEKRELALHPSVAMDPETGRAWIAYEDWSDQSIKLAHFDGEAWGLPVRISESGQNYRPKVVVTKKNGKNHGAVSIAWDAYRNGQYDIYLRLMGPGGGLGPEIRATESGRWDSTVDMIEDLDGNLWITWLRASNELSEMNAMRDVHVKFWDGEQWRFPNPPDILYDNKKFRRVERFIGDDPEVEFPRGYARNSGGPEDKEGRLTWYTVNWFPKLAVDGRNRVYVFYRGGEPMFPMMYGHVDYRVYEGDRWSEPRTLKLDREMNLVRILYDFSVVIDKNQVIEGFWDSYFLGIGKTLWEVRKTDRVAAPDAHGPRCAVTGEAYRETIHRGWPARQTMEPRAEAEIAGARHVLLYGDTHAHSWTSDGTDPADFYYNFAKDIAQLDFFALSDHDFIICHTPGVEAYISFLPVYFSREDFICFQAYEFTNGAKGHRVVVFEGDDKPTFPLGVFNTQRGKQANTTGQLYCFMHRFAEDPEERVLVTSHNMLQLGNDFSEYDESLEPLYDVTTLHVAAERSSEEYRAEGRLAGDNNIVRVVMAASQLTTGGARARTPEKKWYYSFRQCLDAGLPLGAYGASDTHSSNGIGWITAGLWVKERTRKAVFDAMFERHSVALDNLLRITDIWNTVPGSSLLKKDLPVLRIDLRFWLDSHLMGSKCRIESAPTARIYARGHDPADPLRRLMIIKDGKEVHFMDGFGSNQGEGEWKDERFDGGKHYYYARAEFSSGSLAISSPVFVNY